ncbi:membrane-bound lytic murein transglycosylase MltF [Guyparkeria hydrothermalis]|uniref:membrane-bound lytic murein transglycosylase MltF n=1 Tax=Guyparkeria hydrothermalis TaxID=923 RepID=UPI0020200B66|nr:membrane-bound lytic murein transglycosylase MltF [Guyparkeria hydrothermalis]MCL7744335.1 membrane-bound lytic murein transglycosylase MltF [Guyparkeria hydrothermalis]
MKQPRRKRGIGRWLIPLVGVGALFAAPLAWWIHTWTPGEQPTRLAAIDVADSFKRTPQLTQVSDRGVLRVATMIEPTLYIPDSYRPQGLEYDLTGRFADRLGVDVEYLVVPNIDAAYEAVAENRADLAAAGLAIDPARQERFAFSPPYLTVSRKLIHAVDQPIPSGLTELAGLTVAVPAGSANRHWLERISRQPGAVPLTIEERQDKLAILEGIRHGDIEYALTLSHTALLAHKLSDDVAIGPIVGPPVSLAWAFSREADDSLLKAARRFFAEIRSDQQLRGLVDRHYAQFERLDESLSRRFLQDLETRARPYLRTFRRAGERYEIDWRLLASVGYQESKWQPDAVSHQGAYGLMQIILPTARGLGLTDPSNPTANIMAGAKYIAQLRELVPEEATEPDRTYLALAAYNVGIGHLSDALVLTRRQGGDPTQWAAVRERLPQLSDPAIYRDMRYGYARGSETVNYVENIRAFHDLMIWMATRENLLAARQ